MQNDETEKIIAEHLASLPEVVKTALYSADTEKLLQNVAKKHKLPYDKWTFLEDAVMLTLVGIDTEEDLRAALTGEIGLDNETAQVLLQDLSEQLFYPVREELERALTHPEAQEKTVSDIETMAHQVSQGGEQENAEETVAATEDAAPTTTEEPVKVERPEASEHYKPGQPSYERKDVVSDPYRETP